MNYDLAMLTLERLTRAPLAINASGDQVEIVATRMGFRELARLCLLLGADVTEIGETLELNPPIHVESGSPALRLRLRDE